MLDFSSPVAPFLTFAAFIAVANIAQGLYLSYKLSRGFGLLFPGKRIGEQFENLLVQPERATKEQRSMLVITIILFFSSVFIIWRVTQTIPLTY